MQKKKRIISLFTILEVCVLLLVASYAWFSDKSSPSINQNNIKVTSAEGLVIKLAPDSDGRTEVDLSEITGDLAQFELKQASSKDTTEFYTIDFGEGLSSSRPKFILVPQDMYGYIDSNRWGILDFTFYLETEDLAKHVYLHKDTSLTGKASNAIRIALTYSVDGNKDTIIFGDEEEDGFEHPYTTQAVIKVGEFDYNDINSEFTSHQRVKTFADKNGGRQENDNDPIDLSKVLFTMNANSMMPVNVKVWLEGGDVDCNNTLASTYADLLLKFGSANVLLDAPNLSANNMSSTINGLTTAMEYAFTNDNATIWKDVTNPSMTFARGTTVYVRIKEVPGVSPSSYVTQIIFN